MYQDIAMTLRYRFTASLSVILLFSSAGVCGDAHYRANG